jgi:hypothetical protein
MRRGRDEGKVWKASESERRGRGGEGKRGWGCVESKPNLRIWPAIYHTFVMKSEAMDVT